VRAEGVAERLAKAILMVVRSRGAQVDGAYVGHLVANADEESLSRMMADVSSPDDYLDAFVREHRMNPLGLNIQGLNLDGMAGTHATSTLMPVIGTAYPTAVPWPSQAVIGSRRRAAGRRSVRPTEGDAGARPRRPARSRTL
jgi:hypothetical protein